MASEGWSNGQSAYEKWSLRIGSNQAEDYEGQRQGMEDVYREIPITGRCLDVGGNDGRLRAFLSDGQEYISIDPFIDILREPRPPEFWEAYSSARTPLNFVSAAAENLPFANESFDTIHMRSMLGHFSNPELALRESFRVLKPEGILVIGLLVKGKRTGRDGFYTPCKEIARTFLVAVGLSRFRDHHIWHPTYKELCGLVEATGLV